MPARLYATVMQEAGTVNVEYPKSNPVNVRKVKGGYRVSTPGGVKAKRTTKAKAQSQRRLLQGVEHGWKPTGKRRK